jgi:predicted 2-oxoglutarate/Fe(II)-dependent dioxygenase YbiX
MIVKENFISDDFCDYLIDVFKNNPQLHNEHPPFLQVIYLQDIMELDTIKKLTGLISHHCITELDKNAYINYHQIAEWKTGAFQGLHKDYDFHNFTSVLYLNDNFEGGQTLVNDEISHPKKGKLISFAGKDLIHEVRTVTKGTRYTVPVWYKLDYF